MLYELNGVSNWLTPSRNLRCSICNLVCVHLNGDSRHVTPESLQDMAKQKNVYLTKWVAIYVYIYCETDSTQSDDHNWLHRSSHAGTFSPVSDSASQVFGTSTAGCPQSLLKAVESRSDGSPRNCCPQQTSKGWHKTLTRPISSLLAVLSLKSLRKTKMDLWSGTKPHSWSCYHDNPLFRKKMLKGWIKITFPKLQSYLKFWVLLAIGLEPLDTVPIASTFSQDLLCIMQLIHTNFKSVS